MSTTAYRRALIRKVEQNLDTADRMIARHHQGKVDGTPESITYYKGFREANIDLLVLISDMEDGL